MARELPIEVFNRIFTFMSHPTADILRKRMKSFERFENNNLNTYKVSFAQFMLGLNYAVSLGIVSQENTEESDSDSDEEEEY